MGERNLVSRLEDQRPKNWHLYALADRVGTNKGCDCGRSPPIIGCLHKPTRDVIERFPSCYPIFKNLHQLLFLFLTLPLRAQVRWISTYIRFSARVFEIDLRSGETVLDLGSGGGIDVLLSAKRVGPTGKAYGLDMTDEMLALARQNQQRAGATNVTAAVAFKDFNPTTRQRFRRSQHV